MTDILGRSDLPDIGKSSGEGSAGPNTQHSGTPYPEQVIAASNDDSSDTRDGYVNTPNHDDASNEILDAVATVEEKKKLLRKRRLATTAIAASVALIAGGIWLSVGLRQPASQPLHQTILTTATHTPTTITSPKPYIAPEFRPPETSNITTTTTSAEQDPSIIDRTQELSTLSKADAEKVKQYKALPHSFSIASEAAQQQLVAHSCKGFDLWLRTKNEGNIADQIVGGGNTHSKAEVKQAFESFWAQTRTFLGQEFGQEGLPVLSCEQSLQVEKTNYNCNNSSALGTRQDVVMNIAFITPSGTSDNKVPIVQLHFKDITYCPAFNRNFGEEPTEAGVVAVFWKLPEVRMGAATIDTDSWQIKDPKFDAMSPQGKWQAPTEPASFYSNMRSN